MSTLELFKLDTLEVYPTGMSLLLPSGFTRSNVLPNIVPLPDVVIGRRAARRWVDIMNTNTAICLYSETVVCMVEEEGLRGMEFFPVEIGQVESPHLQAERPWPRYFVGRVTGRIGAIVTTNAGEPLLFDEATGMYRTGDGLLKRGQVQPETWDGSDFMHLSTIPATHRFCTARVKAAVEKRKLSNFNFYPPYEPDVFAV